MSIPMIGGVVVFIVTLVIVYYISIYNKLRRLSVKVEEGSSDIDVALEKRYDLLSEEIEAVKKFLKHEYDTYLSVTAVRAEKELKEQTLKQKKALSEEALKTIEETIKVQQEQMERIKKQLKQQDRSSINKDESQQTSEIYENSVDVHKMNLNSKIGMLASIQQGLGGVGTAIDALSEQYPVLYSHISMNHFQRSIFDAEEHLQAARRLYNANVSLYNQKIGMFPYSIVAGLHGMNKANFYQVDEKKKKYQVNFDGR